MRSSSALLARGVNSCLFARLFWRHQQQFSAGVEYVLTSARCLSFVHPKPNSACKTLHNLSRGSLTPLPVILQLNESQARLHYKRYRRKEDLNTDNFNILYTTCMYVPHLTATDKQLEFLLLVFCYASILCGTEASAQLLLYVGQKCYQDTSIAAK